TQTLRDTAVNLTLDLRRVDRAPHVMGCVHLKYLHGPQLEVYLDFGCLRGEAIGCVRRSLSVAIERRGGRIEETFADGDIALIVGGELGQSDAPTAVTAVRSKPVLLD